MHTGGLPRQPQRRQTVRSEGTFEVTSATPRSHAMSISMLSYEDTNTQKYTEMQNRDIRGHIKTYIQRQY